MQNRSIEDYIIEMEKMKARAIVPADKKVNVEIEEVKTDEAEEHADLDSIEDDREDESEQYDDADDDIEKEDGMGRLTVSVTSGRGLFPVENASVTVSHDEASGGNEIVSVKTDKSGKTPVIYLPAPDKDNSQQPVSKGETVSTRAQYSVTVTAPGYVTAVVEGISVFDDVTAIQKVDMLNTSAADGDVSPRVIDEKTVYRL